MTIERSATILSLDARWFVAAWVDIREEERARVADAWTAITKIEEWCDDPTYVTEMIDLFEAAAAALGERPSDRQQQYPSQSLTRAGHDVSNNSWRAESGENVGHA